MTSIPATALTAALNRITAVLAPTAEALTTTIDTSLCTAITLTTTTSTRRFTITIPATPSTAPTGTVAVDHAELIRVSRSAQGHQLAVMPADQGLFLVSDNQLLPGVTLPRHE